LSGEQGNQLQAIFFASSRRSGGNVLENWENHTRNSNVNRNVRHIYTGNLLQAFERAQGGKLISYTCKSGETKKGILMPEHWTPSERGQNATRSVPLKFCRRAIAGMSRGAVVNTDADISFLLQYDGNIRLIPKSLSIEKFGWMVKNRELLSFISESGGFQKTGSSWVGSVSPRDLQQVIDVIYAEKSCNALLSASQIELIQQDIVRTEVRQKERVDLPEIRENPADSDKARRLRIAKVKAKTKLKILNLIKL
jgi:hypothetical protein